MIKSDIYTLLHDPVQSYAILQLNRQLLLGNCVITNKLVHFIDILFFYVKTSPKLVLNLQLHRRKRYEKMNDIEGKGMNGEKLSL